MSRYRSRRRVEIADGMCLDEGRGEAIWVSLQYIEQMSKGVKQYKSVVEIWTHDKKKRLAASGVCGVNAKRHYDRLNSYYFG
ncbi:MAG: hypothetical protein ACRDDZ_06325 [Marinifilaceae bacterium]